MKTVRRSLSVALVSALALSGLGLSASADEPAGPMKPTRDRPLMAAGVIVTTTNAKPSAALLREAESELPDDVDVAKVRSKGNRKTVLVTDQRIPAADAESLAAELRQRSDVVSASPNYINHAFGVSPVTTNDPYFPDLKQIWDPRTKTDSRVKAIMGSANKFPSGGYSSRAPALWRETTGTNQVVAVLDTGITAHPDLDNQVLPGYDFVSMYPLEDENGDPIDPEDTGRDGNGRDDNPDDEGDWEDAGYCQSDSSPAPSSWHGTHVSGIIAAERDNASGTVGVAPGVKILPVRVLGLCGGTDEDLADAIRWAAGLPAPGVPADDVNDNPADVINLSLGGSYRCTDAPYLAEAIAAARVAGSVVVAAAGNGGVNLGTDPVSPATCAGVISVGSSSEYGDRAGYRSGPGKKTIYSNYGRHLDISAPGGDTYWDGRGIISAFNTGLEGPEDPAYAQYIGTSTAAPVVSAAAALIRSLGTFTPAQTDAALKAAVAPFPSGTGAAANFKKCTTAICGKGILDLGRVPASLSGPTITPVTPVVGEPLTAAPGSWNGTPSAFSYVWFRGESPISGATASSYTVTQADVGTNLSVRLAPANTVFAPIRAKSLETITVPQGPTVTLTGPASPVTYGEDASVTVTVTDGGGPVNGPVEIRRGSTVLASGETVGGTVTLTVPGLNWVGGVNRIRAAFLGASKASSLSKDVDVTRASSSISTSLSKSVKRTKKATLTFNVTAPGPAPTGKVTVRDGGKLIVTYNLYASHVGRRTVSLPVLSRVGNHWISVKYEGNTNLLPKTAVSRILSVTP